MPADGWFEGVFLYQVHLHSQEVAEVMLKRDDLYERERTLVKLHQQVQVAPRSLLAAHV
jgi:hypothetical protein